VVGNAHAFGRITVRVLRSHRSQRASSQTSTPDATSEPSTRTDLHSGFIDEHISGWGKSTTVVTDTTGNIDNSRHPLRRKVPPCEVARCSYGGRSPSCELYFGVCLRENPRPWQLEPFATHRTVQTVRFVKNNDVLVKVLAVIRAASQRHSIQLVNSMSGSQIIAFGPSGVRGRIHDRGSGNAMP
jgi:hypothetical protein